MPIHQVKFNLLKKEYMIQLLHLNWKISKDCKMNSKDTELNPWLEFAILLNSQCPKYRFPSNTDFSSCRGEIAASINDFSNIQCKWENAEPDTLREWKINILKSIVTRISFYFRNTNLLPPKPKSSFVILSEVSRIFIWSMFWFLQIKPQTIL